MKFLTKPVCVCVCVCVCLCVHSSTSPKRWRLLKDMALKGMMSVIFGQTVLVSPHLGAAVSVPCLLCSCHVSASKLFNVSVICDVHDV